MYDYPEKFKTDRERFRRNLKSFGFGIIQKSILISPLPFEENIQKYIEAEANKSGNSILWLSILPTPTFPMIFWIEIGRRRNARRDL